MGLKDLIGRTILRKGATPMLENMMTKVSGKKTYITLGLGIVVAVIGHFWGPIDVGPIDIPAISSADMWQAIWLGLSGTFLRQGVSKSTTPSA